jgi:hypothetical protein
VIDTRVLATRAIGRRLESDHAGALPDLRALLDLERDPARCVSIEQLLRMLETTR